MVKAEVVPAEQSHVEALAATMRLDDINELWASSRSSPEEALSNALKASHQAWTGLVDGQVVCMFGVVSQSWLHGTGYPWMLGSDLIVTHQTLFLRRCRRQLAAMAQSFQYLHNYVDARNQTAIKWLEWLGFEVEEPEPWGVAGLPFRHFEMRVNHV